MDENFGESDKEGTSSSAGKFDRGPGKSDSNKRQTLDELYTTPDHRACISETNPPSLIDSDRGIQDSERQGGGSKQCRICLIKLKLEGKFAHTIPIADMNETLCDKHRKLTHAGTSESKDSDFDENVYRHKIRSILTALERSPCATDMKLCLYMAASSGENPTMFLRPYPGHLVQENTEGFKKLWRLNSEIPRVESLGKYLDAREGYNPDPDVVDLLHWLLVRLGEPRLVSLPKEEISQVMKKVAPNLVSRPTAVFKLMVSQLSQQESRWRSLKIGYHLSMGYYSMRLENAFAVVHRGIGQELHEGGIGGVGIYLTNDLITALDRSPEAPTWDKSYLGTKMSVVAIVEFIEHASVRYYKAGSETDNTETGQTRIPIVYYVPKSEYTRVRYLLVYRNKPDIVVLPEVPPVQVDSNTLLRRILRRKTFPYIFVALLMSYATIKFFRQSKMTK